MAQLDFKNLLNLDAAFEPRNEADWEFLRAAAQNLFRPKAPIEDNKLFQGMIKQVNDVLDVVYEDGAHAVIFGERGVGKTSLTNIIEKRVVPLISAIVCIKVQCSPDDDFYGLWAEAMGDYEYEGSSMRQVFEDNKTLHTVYKMESSNLR